MLSPNLALVPAESFHLPVPSLCSLARSPISGRTPISSHTGSRVSSSVSFSITTKILRSSFAPRQARRITDSSLYPLTTVRQSGLFMARTAMSSALLPASSPTR